MTSVTSSRSANGRVRGSGGILAQRAALLSPSVLHAVQGLVEEQERVGKRRVIALHVGEPSFTPSLGVKAAIARVLCDDRTQYSDAAGLDILRERLAEKVSRKNGLDISGRDIIVTPGSTQALLAVMLAACSPGDEILLPEIHWPIYRQAAALAGLKVGLYRSDGAGRLDPEHLPRAASARTRAIVINSPANPTGAVLDRSVLGEVLRLARLHRWWVISDEAYEDFVYEGAHLSIGALERSCPPPERLVFSVYSFSKSYGMTGYRMGYVAAPSRAATAALRRVQEAAIVAPSTPIQYGALAALRDDDVISRAYSQLETTRAASLSGLVDAGLLAALPAGGWYALLDISMTGLTGGDFARRLLAGTGVAVAPGHAFVGPWADDPATVRVAFCGDGAVVSEGCTRLLRFATALASGARRPEATRAR